MTRLSVRTLALVLMLFAPLGAMAQGTQIAFAGLRVDRDAPLEVTADQLTLDQATATALFRGHVEASQGTMRLVADEVEVTYAEGGGEIRRIEARGHVLFVNGEDAAEAAEAVYLPQEARLLLSGGVLLTQGPNALAGERLVVDLATGHGVMEGRVKTILRPAGEKP